MLFHNAKINVKRHNSEDGCKWSSTTTKQRLRNTCGLLFTSRRPYQGENTSCMYKKGDLPLPPHLATTPSASQILCVAIPIVPVARHGICCERGHQYKRRLVETARPWASSEPAHPPSRKTQMSSRPKTGPHGASRDSILRLSPFLNREKGPGAGAGRLVFAGRRDCGAEGPAVQPARAAPWVTSTQDGHGD